MIKISNLTHIYKQADCGIVALNDISLNIHDGEFVVFAGRNGSGKSTLAKHLNGLLTPTKGIIEVDGLKTHLEENLWKVRQRVGMIFQNPDNQIVATVVEEDVAFGLENLGIPRNEIRERVDNALKSVHMLKYARFEPHLLSGGQKQRVAIAGVLAMKPKYLVLDEPTSMLDPKGKKEVIEIVRKLNSEQEVTVILITHSVDEVIYADRVVAMDCGAIVSDASPRSFFGDTKLLKEIGIEPPPAVLLSRELKNEGYNLKEALSIKELAGNLCSLN
ncbi:energy-coupling factor transporter ATPase [Candidatus Oleimmundimicrobium sp.]|uniref:energy-coupling factor transporter ATPase n=1 Tax=Candidatus Oleimmundimicrobium sp. TaxID=3060597 RepID=UPI00271D5CDB|nr:energy-coupling factor transporter ATPase [Candidatus Oleimmundimicrobium sp.]MDO8886033.1 energy-coupling factor transporter ATPase [Candidatus Oleimmundimicrobium sp.]